MRLSGTNSTGWKAGEWKKRGKRETYLCSWFAIPLGCSNLSLECRSCSWDGPQSRKAFRTVSVSGPVCRSKSRLPQEDQILPTLSLPHNSSCKSDTEQTFSSLRTKASQASTVYFVLQMTNLDNEGCFWSLVSLLYTSFRIIQRPCLAEAVKLQILE